MDTVCTETRKSFRSLKSRIMDSTRFDEHCTTLTDSQKKWVDLLDSWFAEPTRLVVLISGGPGSGKTHGVIETLKFIDAATLKMAPTAKIAKKISGKTIHSALHLAWGPGSKLYDVEKYCSSVSEEPDYVDLCLKYSAILMNEMKYHQSKVEIIIIDEVGMIPFWFMYQIIDYFFQRVQPILIVAMGDSWQLRPVQSEYNIFHITFAKFETRHIEMVESKRFSEEYKRIIDCLRECMNDQDEEKVLDYVRSVYPVVDAIDANLLIQCDKALVYTNSTVETYNKFYLTLLKGSTIRMYKIQDGTIFRDTFTDLKSDCLVCLTENGCCQFSNGTLLTFKSYDSSNDTAVCKSLDNTDRVRVCRSQYTHVIPLVPGFASTIHKFQGETINDPRIVFNFDGCKDIRLIYTALSRVRSMDQILAIQL